MIKFTIISGGIFCMLAVAFGAFGAHALQDFLMEQQRTETYQTAVQYQFYHALGLLFLALLIRQYPTSNFLKYAIYCTFVGIIFFSGSLYVLCFTGLGILGAITPIGGVFFILAWVFLIIAALKLKFE